jgi:hypothetical protein
MPNPSNELTADERAAYAARAPYRAAITKALSPWPGQPFRAGEKAQCMNFTRHVLDSIHVPLADAITKRPLDGHWTGPELASSLAGTDLGEEITDIYSLQTGDILFFDDTYYVEGFPPGTITHVAICERGQQFVHRPTSARPVERATLTGYWVDKFRAAIRPTVALVTLPAIAPTTDPEPARAALWKVYVGPQKGAVLLDQVAIDANGRATMTAQVLAGLIGCKLVINNEVKGIRFEPLPLPKETSPPATPPAPRRAATITDLDAPKKPKP